MKAKKVTYNPNGLKRIDNIVPCSCTLNGDINSNNINIVVKDGYWKISNGEYDNIKMRKNIGKNLLNYRKKWGYSQKHIATYLDIDRSIINDYENEKKDISLVHLDKLCDLFNIELEDFIKQIDINKMKIIPTNRNNSKQDMISIAAFHSLIKNYTKMNKINI